LDLHSGAVSASHFAAPMPCSVDAFLLKATAKHGRRERRSVGYLPAFGFFLLPRGFPRRLLSEEYQSSSQRYIPTTVKGGSSTLQTDDLLNCWTSSSDISGYHTDFHEDCYQKSTNPPHNDTYLQL